MSLTFPIENRAPFSGEAFDRLAAILRLQRSIRHAVDWWATFEPRLAPPDMVTRDEFSHDLIVDLGDGLWIVYDST
ncbi:MAG: hypothetical protein NVSMB14_01980 [Isosphaeraceae bacterium]